MYGLEAISANNGWAISVLGICIVFTGLVALSTMISQIHKVLGLWEDRDKWIARWKSGKAGADAIESCPVVTLTDETRESSRIVGMLIARLGEPFSLPRLLTIMGRCGVARPHSTLNDLIRSNVVLPDGGGLYRLNQRVRSER